MKKVLALLAVFALIPFCALAETPYEDVVSSISQALTEAFDYCDVQYRSSDDTLFVNIAIDGFAKNMYEAKENGLDSTAEEWNQIKGMFLSIYFGVVSFFETYDVSAPKDICLQLWNDDVVIRDDHSTGKSRILLAILNGYYCIDEMEAY